MSEHCLLLLFWLSIFQGVKNMSDFAQTKRRLLLTEAALLDLTKVDWAKLDIPGCIYERDKIASRGKRAKKPARSTEDGSEQAGRDS